MIYVPVMSEKALGLIETKGLIGAIEATDAAAKAAAVVVSSVELTDATFLTLRIEGDLGAVQAAVEAAARAAEKVGELVAVHIIPRPDEGLGPILPQRRYVSKYHPEDNRPPLDLEDSEPDLPVKPRPRTPSSGSAQRPTGPTSDITRTRGDYAPAGDKKYTIEELQALTVSELRQIARSMERMPLKGREISMANKNQLIDALKSVLDMD